MIPDRRPPDLATATDLGLSVAANECLAAGNDTFHAARDDFRRAVGMHRLSARALTLDDFGVGCSAADFGTRWPWGDQVPHLDHWEPLGYRRRLAAVVSWPYADPAALREDLAGLGERFAYAVVEPGHPAAEVYPTGPPAFVLADRRTCDAETVVATFLAAEWAVDHAAEQQAVTARWRALDDERCRRRGSSVPPEVAL